MKEKYNIEIADIQLSILSDEPEEFVTAVVAQLDERVRDLTVKNKRCSKLDAALLCALDSLGEKMKGDKKIKNLEAQISLYEANISRLREELETARRNAAAAEKQEASQHSPESEKAAPASKETAQEETPAAENAGAGIHDAKLRQIEALLRRRSEAAAPPDSGIQTAAHDTPADSRDAKLREIEELLRRSGGAKSLSEALQDAAQR